MQRNIFTTEHLKQNAKCPKVLNNLMLYRNYLHIKLWLTLQQNCVLILQQNYFNLLFQTSEGHLILYNVESQSENTAYQQYDPPTASLRRDSAELFVKEVIPSLRITMVKHIIYQWSTRDFVHPVYTSYINLPLHA